MMRKSTLAVALMTAAPALFAQVEVRLEDRTLGRDVPMVRHQGQDFAVGEPGHRYGIRLTNRSGERVLAVLSVDGVNVVTGETANPGQSGYVLGPWQSTVINGWRKNMSEIAAFNFAPLPESYAARTGRPNDVGVIGVAVFHERRAYVQEDNWIAKRESQRGADTHGAPRTQAPGASAEAYDKGFAGAPLGTGHGEREWSHARSTQFVRASHVPSEVRTVYYDSRRNLIAAGILPPPYRGYAQRSPQAFPGFVPDPGW